VKKDKKLTVSQQRVLNELIAFQREHGFSPTASELAGRLGFRSPNTASNHLRILDKKGAIRLTPGMSRGIGIIGDSDEDTAVSLLRSLVNGDEYSREHAIAFLESREVEA